MGGKAMAASKRTKKEFIEEAQMSRSRLQELRRSKVKHKLPAEALKESEEHAIIFASYQQAISELREFYVREASFEQMLQKTVDLFVKSFGYYMAWYGELTPLESDDLLLTDLKSDEKVIIPKVWAGKYEKYLDGLRLELDDSKDAKCAMSIAIVRKEPFGYADLEHDKDFEKWRPLALQYGYRSNQAIPLIIDGKSVGAFLVYSTRLRAFSDDLIRYLVGIANELATIVENITRRKKEGEAYRALVDHSLQGLVIFQDGRVVFANKTMTEITGYALEEMLAASSQQVQARVHPEHRALVWSRHQERLRGKRLPERYEIRGIRKDGTICWLEIHASRIEYQGKPAIQAACVDITERKEAEEALQKRTEELTIINEMAMELAVASSTADIYKLVCGKLKSITGALFTCITSYNDQRQELRIEHISTDSKFIITANKILGRKIKELRIPLEPRHIQEMLSEKAKRLEGLNELMFGTIPKAVVSTLKKALEIGDVYGLVLHYGGKIIGTMAVLMPFDASTKAFTFN
jgi:PAS domain S-box-containing protein